MSARLHSWLLRRYPREFRSRFAASMERDFEDLLAEGRSTLHPILDTAFGAVKENILTTRPLMERPVLLALLGAVCVLPLLVVNHIVAQRIDPVFSWIRQGAPTGPLEWVILWSLIGFLLVGAIVAILPVIRVRQNRWWLVPNLLVAALLVAAFVLLSGALGHDMTCDVIAGKTCD